jgi:hypothetical protein
VVAQQPEQPRRAGRRKPPGIAELDGERETRGQTLHGGSELRRGAAVPHPGRAERRRILGDHSGEFGTEFAGCLNERLGLSFVEGTVPVEEVARELEGKPERIRRAPSPIPHHGTGGNGVVRCVDLDAVEHPRVVRETLRRGEPRGIETTIPRLARP